MRAEDKLHFSPNHIFAKLDFDNKGKLLEAFKDRVCGFYLDPAKLLDQAKFGFASGLLCSATIDFLARITFPKEKTGPRIKKWLKKNIREFKKKDFAERFYLDFRNGLVHEGRIKSPGEFSYESRRIISIDNGIMIVNPGILLKWIEEVFKKYWVDLEGNPNEFAQFRSALMKDFEEEMKRERAQAPN